VNIDDGDIFIGEFASGAICSVQSSFVTVGNYPGIEVRVHGSEGAAIARLIEEFGICETLKVARPDDVEFRDVHVPQKHYPLACPRANPGARSTTPTSRLTSPARCSAKSKAMRATSTTAYGCSRS